MRGGRCRGPAARRAGARDVRPAHRHRRGRADPLRRRRGRAGPDASMSTDAAVQRRRQPRRRCRATACAVWPRCCCATKRRPPSTSRFRPTRASSGSRARASTDRGRRSARRWACRSTCVRTSTRGGRRERCSVVVMNFGNPQASSWAAAGRRALPASGSGARASRDVPREDQRRVRARRNAGVGADSDLGARRRADLSSGTGSCASLIAAAAFGGAARDAEVIAPGGTQRVEWDSDSVYLTGWAEVLFDGDWQRR